MKKLYFLLFLFGFQFSHSQDLLIENQAQLNALTPPISISGNLSIISDGSDDIFDLSNLSSLTTITGTLTINNNPILSNLDNLNALTTISGGIITIQNNKNLYSFCGLGNIAGSISEIISGNSFNQSFAEFKGVNCKAQDVVFTGNLSLATQAAVDLLPEYTMITGKLDILAGDISNLSKLSKLRSIGGRLLIQDSPLLTDLTGLKALEVIGSSSVAELAIRRMSGLKTLNGLQALRTVSQRIGFWQNPVLETLEGLNNLKLIKDNSSSDLIRIGTLSSGGGNPMLEDLCALSGIINIIGASVLDADPLSYINNETTFNPTFQNISDGICTSVYIGDLTVTTQESVDALPLKYTKITGKLDILGANGNLIDLSKFNELRNIGGRLLIQDCPLVTDLTGLSSLQIIGSASSQELAVRRMAGLKTLNGLQSLNTVSKRIGFWQNPVLETLEGLNNLKLINDNVSSELIRIGTSSAGGGNPLLKNFCALKGIIDIIGAPKLDADPLSYINNETDFNPTFQEISDGECEKTLSLVDFEEGVIKLYPNPTSDMLKIESSTPIVFISIINSLGKEVLKTKETTINVSKLPTGIYFARLYYSNKFISRKIIVIK